MWCCGLPDNVFQNEPVVLQVARLWWSPTRGPGRAIGTTICPARYIQWCRFFCGVALRHMIHQCGKNTQSGFGGRMWWLKNDVLVYDV